MNALTNPNATFKQKVLAQLNRKSGLTLAGYAYHLNCTPAVLRDFLQYALIHDKDFHAWSIPLERVPSNARVYKGARFA